jgi:RNA polymerase sigma-70 factor, ECF subfamily
MHDLRQLYQAYSRDVHRFALYLSGDRALAEDITSETFLRAWCSAAPIRAATVKSYLFTIARNVYLESRRRTVRQVPLDETLPAAGPDLERQAQQRNRLEVVLRALGGLPEIDRAALLMRSAAEMAYEDIARALGLNVSAAKVRVHRARLKLAALLPREVLP